MRSTSPRSSSPRIIRAKLFCDVNRRAIDLRRVTGLVFHYSIPSIEETGDGIYEDASEIESNKIAIDRPSVLVSRLNPEKARVIIATPHHVPTVCSTEFVSLSPRGENDLLFLSYVYQSQSTTELLNSMARSVTRSHRRVEPDAIHNLLVNLPPPESQRAIAAFLEQETAEADNLAARYEKLIELLEERRVAIVTNAVTRGINNAAPLKCSGVEWIGKIPEHWQMQKLRRVIKSSTNGFAGDQVAEIPGVTKPVTRIETISAGTISLERVGWVLETPSLSRYRLIDGDILFSHINSLSMIGKCAFYDGSPELYVGVNLLRIRPNDTLMSEYLHKILSSTVVRQMVRSRAKPAINQASINTESIMSIEIPVPPKDEQIRLNAYIENAIIATDRAVAKVRSAITLIKERRSALITAAMTGQIDVHNYRPAELAVEVVM